MVVASAGGLLDGSVLFGSTVVGFDLSISELSSKLMFGRAGNWLRGAKGVDGEGGLAWIKSVRSICNSDKLFPEIT